MNEHFLRDLSELGPQCGNFLNHKILNFIGTLLSMDNLSLAYERQIIGL